jgi:hypothetical protein
VEGQVEEELGGELKDEIEEEEEDKGTRGK